LVTCPLHLQMHKNSNIQVLREFDEQTSSYLKDKLFGDKIEKRAKWEKLFEDQVFSHKHILTLDQ